jgi:sigma-E factor negative regulatory protein RseC
MVEEFGSIVELKGREVAVVLCEKSTFCQNCASMESCQVGDDNKSKLVEALNTLGAEVGDRVKLAVSSKTFLQSSFLLYIVPLIALIVGAVCGEVLGSTLEVGPDPNLLAAVLGTAFMVASFFVIRVGSRAIPKESFMPRIVAIVPEEEVFVEELKHGH